MQDRFQKPQQMSAAVQNHKAPYYQSLPSLWQRPGRICLFVSTASLPSSGTHRPGMLLQNLCWDVPDHVWYWANWLLRLSSQPRSDRKPAGVLICQLSADHQSIHPRGSMECCPKNA
eukprot:Mycagemm_TRINITY_DN9888_c0_g1::TRINITY_DN9888_c0_g1_i2::g.203::m.203 type:complete len:117 gc:universal TRINITY_DN9888_c0_g1_i2:397-47(-)